MNKPAQAPASRTQSSIVQERESAPINTSHCGPKTISNRSCLHQPTQKITCSQLQPAGKVIHGCLGRQVHGLGFLGRKLFRGTPHQLGFLSTQVQAGANAIMAGAHETWAANDQDRPSFFWDKHFLSGLLHQHLLNWHLHWHLLHWQLLHRHLHWHLLILHGLHRSQLAMRKRRRCVHHHWHHQRHGDDGLTACTAQEARKRAANRKSKCPQCYFKGERRPKPTETTLQNPESHVPVCRLGHWS